MKHHFLLLVLLPAISSKELCKVSEPRITGNVTETVFGQNHAINEASGLAASRRNPGVLYTHNDSGDSGRVFAIDVEGYALVEFRFAGFDPLDMEDICAGTMNGINYVFAADLGNNWYSREEIKIIRFEEPDLSTEWGVIEMSPSDYVTYTIKSGNMLRQDQETMFFDQVSGYLYFVQKNHTDASADIHRFSPTDFDSNVEPEKVGHIPFQILTAGDISIDGTRILMKNWNNTGYMWKRNPLTSVEDTLMYGNYCILDLEPEPQGEALAISPNQTGFFTTSEGISQPIYWYQFQDELGTEEKERKSPGMLKLIAYMISSLIGSIFS